MLVRCIIVCLLVMKVTTGFNQLEWRLRKDKNGIKVYTGKEPGQNYESIKVEAQLTGTLEKIRSILVDVSNTKNWVYSTKEAYLIKKINSNNFIYYTQTSLPWPVSNRDVQIHMQLDENSNSLKVTALGEPDALPAKKGIVRIPYFYSSWNVTYLGSKKLNVLYILKMDPGGNIPAAITSMFIAKGPYETFNNLAELLQQ